MSNKDLEKREQIEMTEEEEKEVEGYCIYTKSCKTTTKKNCQTDCVFNSAVYTCEK